MSSSIILRLMASLTVLLQTGCANFDESPPPASMRALPEFRETLQEQARGLRKRAEWPNQEWWKSFAQDELNRLMDTALSDNPDLKIAAARLRQSQSLVDRDAAELYPTLEARASFSAQRYSANSVQARFAGENFRLLLVDPLVLRYHLDFWGRDHALLQASIDHALASAAELADAKVLLSASLAGAFFDLQVASAQTQIAQDLVSSRESLLKLELARHASGLSSEAPLLQARLALADARQTLAQADADDNLARNRLAALAGRGSDWGRSISPGEAHLPAPPALPVDLPLHFLRHRPDLAAARLEALSAANAVEVAQTAFYPDVNLIAFSGLHSVSLTDVLLQGSSLAYAIGPSISFPLFEGGRLRARLSEQHAAYDAAVERYNALLLRAVQEVADALAQWRETEIQLSAQIQAIADAEQTLHLASTLSENGLTDSSRPLNARVELARQRWRLASMQGAQAKAAVRLCKALGGGYQEPPGLGTDS